MADEKPRQEMWAALARIANDAYDRCWSKVMTGWMAFDEVRNPDRSFELLALFGIIAAIFLTLSAWKNYCGVSHMSTSAFIRTYKRPFFVQCKLLVASRYYKARRLVMPKRTKGGDGEHAMARLRAQQMSMPINRKNESGQ